MKRKILAKNYLMLIFIEYKACTLQTSSKIGSTVMNCSADNIIKGKNDDIDVHGKVKLLKFNEN